MSTKELFNAVIINKHKNTPDKIRFLLDNGFIVVYPTHRSVPNELKNHKQVKVSADNLDGLDNYVVYSDHLLINSLDNHFAELKKVKKDGEFLAQKMIKVCENQINMMSHISDRLRSEIDLIDKDNQKLGFFGSTLKYRKVSMDRKRKSRLLDQIWMNSKFIKRLNTSILEMKHIKVN